ncbi:hypothetical protein Dimus_021082 [Dionaea muscipula]
MEGEIWWSAGREIYREAGRIVALPTPEKHASASQRRLNRIAQGCNLSHMVRGDTFRLADLERAVKLYNKAQENKDKELELVDAPKSNPFLVGGLAYHLNFTAKPKDGPDVETKRYFAELIVVGYDEHKLTKICPVEPKAANSIAEITYHCWVCNPRLDVYHPDKDFMVDWQKLHKYYWSPSLTLPDV